MDYQTFKKELHNLGTNTTNSATQILDLTLNLVIKFLNSNNSLPISFREEFLSLVSSYQSELSIFENLHQFLLQEHRPWTKISFQELIVNYKNSNIKEEN
jgi:hypothetical protein